MRRPHLIGFLFAATLSAVAAADVVIDMPAPSQPKQVAPAVSPAVDTGDLALARYQRARRSPYNTYATVGRRGYRSYSTYWPIYDWYGPGWYGRGVWWGSCVSVRPVTCTDATTPSQ